MEEQISKLLGARQILLLKMTDITSARRDIFSQLGLEMLALPEVTQPLTQHVPRHQPISPGLNVT